MTLDSRSIMNWMVILAVLLGILVLGRPLLVPLALAVLVWAILNAMVSALQRFGLPRWLALLGSFALVFAGLYLAVRVTANDAGALANRFPSYVAELQAFSNSLPEFLHQSWAPHLTDFLGRTNIASILTTIAASVGRLLFDTVGVAVYTGFLLAEQHVLPAKIAQIADGSSGHERREQLIHDFAGQVQSYLGVCTLVSVMMAVTSYIVLTALHVEFAGFWTLLMFALAYIPYIGAVGVFLPALAALAQFGTLGPFLIIVGVLITMHLFVNNIVETVLLGRSLDLSLLAIILSLSLWGLIWGIAGMFLAVPITGAMAIVCRHVDGLKWVAILLAGKPPREAGRSN
jgi:AI-2 transport protein TqsA